jgi:hypothetical protein
MSVPGVVVRAHARDGHPYDGASALHGGHWALRRTLTDVYARRPDCRVHSKASRPVIARPRMS